MEQNEVDNEVAFLDLLVAIETSNQHLSLLLAVCDRDRLRNSLTERYEQELASEGINAYRVTIDRQEPSLFAAINQLVEAEPYLQAGNPAVITVEGAASLSSFASEGERSPVDKFLGYLQWTREGMRQFAFPIVIWVTEHIHNEISRKAQDFYSWREGVFFFESIQEEPIVPIVVEPILLSDPETDDLDLPIDELLVYIAQREATGQEDASLATFYTLLAKAYERDNQIDHAIAIWQKAIHLQEKLKISLQLATSLNSLAILYHYQGKYSKSEPLYLRSLAIREQKLGIKHLDVATSLNNLAELYRVQGKYSEAEPLYLRSLEIRKQQLGEDHPDIANSFNNLAILYKSQGKYTEAEHLYLKSLEINKRIYGEDHLDIAVGLNNLAELYELQGKYSEAEPLYLRSLEIRKEKLGVKHPYVAASLNNLAGIYDLQGRYSEAELLYLGSLAIWERQLGVNHPDVAASLNNLALLYNSQGKYSEAEPLYLRSLKITECQLGVNHPNVAISLHNLAILRYEQNRYDEAKALLIQALKIQEIALGDNHPDTQKTKENLAYIQANHQSQPIFGQDVT
ncbi:tetratricopeptide repeat protein [Pseudanabaena sp. ABRG5-3]|uniref:tetratricopeptide repeat protein n=1 Tax=Pseudanabaena sp. ABRG5-3 TaxID=685565 RepID=UPI000DC7362F|nr:tetratricopeptide repeat protein [Pseudanabaena sp. ABRG5-3]BBC25770.1 tetratricopeptide TPR_2 repeat protein [Pseudanabaena sp. ABRG5-3]